MSPAPIRTRLALPLVLAVTAAILATEVPARAAVFTPTRFDDPVPDGCNPGDCSLREAIRAANAAAGPDTIPLQAGTYTLQQVGTAEDAALDGDLDITGDVTITGQGAAVTVIDGNGGTTGERVFEIDPLTTGPNVTMQDVLIRGGTGGFGAGIRVTNAGNLTLSSSTVTQNGSATLNFGGGVRNDDSGTVLIEDSVITDNVIGGVGAGILNQNDGVMTILRSVVSGNRAADGTGGGIRNQNEAVLTVGDSTVTGNTATTDGGGIYLDGDSQTTITNTTVSGNQSGEDGGGVLLSLQATAMFTNVTVTGNRADFDGNGTGDGGGVRVNDTFTGAFSVQNTIVAGNVDPTSDSDCRGALTSGGYNLIGVVSPGCAFTAATGDRTGTPAAPIDPRLGPLADNGGPTMTHALLSGSPAIDGGNPATPGSGGSACAAADQRGLARNCDIGAYELVLCATVPVNRIGTPGDDTLTGTDGPDGFLAGAGNDTATGLAGDDAFCLEGGNDTADGGEGNDYLDGGDGDDALTGGPGDDTILGGLGNDTGVGLAGKDTFLGGDGNDKGKGGAGKDLLKGQKGKDRLNGGSGKDRLIGGGGKDRLNCGAGKKEVGKGGPGKDKARKCEKGKP